MKKLTIYIQFAAILVLGTSAGSAQVPNKDKVVSGAERAFEKTAKSIVGVTPGCAVGVSLNGESVFEKAFGLAEMEHIVPNTAQTVFESGSVAKQFTAGALVLLQQDGKLSIDDPVRKYLPELPDYGTPLTIRHLLNHTSGLRDWFAVKELSGDGAGDHIVTQQMVFDTIVRQKALDFKPGEEFSYSNSGYQLAAMIVERVSKQKFTEFVTERLLKPVGLKNTGYRDDFQRITPGRAQAYSKSGDGPWRLRMPMMNVYGGGGMLTTAGDWLKWNAMLEARTWNAGLVESLESQGVLNSGQKINYALGLQHGSYKGNRHVSHTGSTAAYRTVLVRFPERKVSIAVLCNGTLDGGGVAYSIADEIFGPYPEPPLAAVVEKLPIQQPEKYVGLWKNERNRTATRISVTNGELRFGNTPVRAMPDGSMMVGATKVVFKNDSSGKPVSFDATTNSDTIRCTAESEWQPGAADLTAFGGDWYSDDAEAKVKVVVEDQKVYLLLKNSPQMEIKPLYKDAFTDGSGQMIWFDRDSSGRIVGMHIGASRMRDMPFVRVK